MNVQPTEKELQILQVLWERGPCTVRTVHEHLPEGRAAAYTTTLKLMQIMHEKGILDREPQGRGHIYRPLVNEADVQDQLVDRLIDRVFRGSASKLVVRALGNAKHANPAELAEIQALIARMQDAQQQK